MKIKFKKLSKDAITPLKSTDGAAAFDLFTIEEGMIQTEGVTVFDTGIAIEIPVGYVGLIFGRSGLAFKNAIQNCTGTSVIDSDFRGAIKIGLVKHDKEAFFHIKKGDRIAQVFFLKLPTIILEETDKLSETKRGLNGLGSTGVSMTVEEAMRKL